jgi:mRNA interferase RelE/StbE
LAWKIEIDPRARNELARLDRDIQRRITRFLAERLGQLDDPRSIGQPLRGPVLGRFWKYRVGDYRVICDIQQQTLTVLVLRIGHRREVYR